MMREEIEKAILIKKIKIKINKNQKNINHI
jgi:hypothetical protein